MAQLFTVSVDVDVDFGPVAESGIFAELSRAVEDVVNAGVERWQRAVLSAPLWDGERRAYAASITGRMTGPFSGEIVSTYKYVEDIESGRPAYDLKRMLTTSMKVRRNAKGQRYMIIPFRHNTPGSDALGRAMPAEVYESARELAPSRVTGMTKRVSGQEVWDINTRKRLMVPQRTYKWGDRLAAEPEYKLKPHHKTDPYAGMVRFKTNGGSTYMTFRVMSEASPANSWIIPPKPGLWLAKNVAESLQRTAERDFGAAVQRDLAAG